MAGFIWETFMTWTKGIIMGRGRKKQIQKYLGYLRLIKGEGKGDQEALNGFRFQLWGFRRRENWHWEGHKFRRDMLSLVVCSHCGQGRASQVALVVKNLHCNAGDIRDASLILGLGRSPGVGNGNLFQYSCLENFMGRRTWQAIVHGVVKSQTWLTNWAHRHN